MPSRASTSQQLNLELGTPGWDAGALRETENIQNASNLPSSGSFSQCLHYLRLGHANIRNLKVSSTVPHGDRSQELEPISFASRRGMISGNWIGNRVTKTQNSRISLFWDLDILSKDLITVPNSYPRNFEYELFKVIWKKEPAVAPKTGKPLHQTKLLCQRGSTLGSSSGF